VRRTAATLFIFAFYCAVMSEPTSEPVAADIDEALRTAQLQERAEQHRDLERQQQADDKIVAALSARNQPRSR
jgi:hypothetical protein